MMTYYQYGHRNPEPVDIADFRFCCLNTIDSNPGQWCRHSSKVPGSGELLQLPADRFMAVHKSFIVQLSRVSAVGGNILHVGREQVPVSKTLKDEVFNKIVRRGPGLSGQA